MILGAALKQAINSKSRYILIDVTLYLSYNNRKITALLNNDIDETLISQHFIIENKLQTASVKYMRIAVNGY
jgi:hypothetical protein